MSIESGLRFLALAVAAGGGSGAAGDGSAGGVAGAPLFGAALGRARELVPLLRAAAVVAGGVPMRPASAGAIISTGATVGSSCGRVAASPVVTAAAPALE